MTTAATRYHNDTADAVQAALEAAGAHVARRYNDPVAHRTDCRHARKLNPTGPLFTPVDPHAGRDATWGYLRVCGVCLPDVRRTAAHGL